MNLKDINITSRLYLIMGGVIFLLFSCLGTYVILTAWISTENSARENMIQQTAYIKQIAEQNIGINNTSSIKDIFAGNTFYSNGYPFCINNKGEVLANGKSDLQNLPSMSALDLIAKNSSEKIKTHEIDNNGKIQVFYYSYSPKTNCNIVTWYYQRDMMKMPYLLTTTIIIVGIITMTFIIMVIGYVGRTIVNPLNKSIEFAAAVASGDLTTTLEVNQKDEIGKMAESLRGMSSKLSQIASAITGGATTIATATRQMSTSSEEVSQSVSEQASAIEEITATLDQMTSGLNQVSINANDAENIALETGKSMHKVEKSSEELSQLTEQIIEKANIIHHISAQTRILSLNAAVEAARAGEYGRGFSVVAAEVRNLSDQSSKASEEIESIIEKLQNSSKQTEQNIKELIPQIATNLEMVRNISTSTEEHSKGASQIYTAIITINDQTQNNSSAADEMSAAAQEIASQSNQLLNLSKYFRTAKSKDNANITIQRNKLQPLTQKIKKKKMTHTLSA